MKCSVCGKTEDDFRQQIDEINNIFNDIRDNLKNQISDELSKISQKDIYNAENKKVVREIKDEYLSLNIKLVVENLSSFIKLEPKLLILINYYKSNQYRGSFNIIKDIKESYLNEPLISSSPLAMRLNEKIKKIDLYISNNNIKFNEVIIDYSSLGLIEIPLRHLTEADKNKIESVIMNRIILCPICNALLKKASNASYQSNLAQNDYDDDD